MGTWITMDLETAARCDWPDVPEGIQKRLAARADGDEQEAFERMALSPTTGKIIVAGFHRSDGRRLVLLEGEGGAWRTDDPAFPEVGTFRGTEQQLVAAAWQVLSKDYPQVVTFNGRRFDVPFLMERSRMLGVKPTRADLMGNRFRATEHADVLELMTYFGASGHRPSFDEACWSHGVPSPKEGGIDGASVGKFYRAGRIDEVADYCLRDVDALAELWRMF